MHVHTHTQLVQPIRRVNRSLPAVSKRLAPVAAESHRSFPRRWAHMTVTEVRLLITRKSAGNLQPTTHSGLACLPAAPRPWEGWRPAVLSSRRASAESRRELANKSQRLRLVDGGFVSRIPGQNASALSHLASAEAEGSNVCSDICLSCAGGVLSSSGFETDRDRWTGRIEWIDR